VYEKVYSRTEIRSTSLKREQIDLSRERTLTTLLINNKEFTEAILPILAEKNLESSYSKLLAGWVREYWDTYHDVPKSSIQDIYELKKAHIDEDSTLESVGEFLVSLSEEYNPDDYSNIQYFIDNGEKYVKERNLKCFAEKIQALTAQGKLIQADGEIANYKQAGIAVEKGISVIRDIDKVKEAFSEDAAPMFTFAGDMGKLLGSFYRGDVSCCLAGAKAGKSLFLQHVAETAAEQGLNVVYINLEMIWKYIIRRFTCSMTFQPEKPGTYQVPYFRPDVEPTEGINENTLWTVSSRDQQFDGVSFDDVEKMRQGFSLRYKGGDIRVFSLPAEGTGPAEIEALLDSLAYYDRFVPDVVVLDYATLMSSKGAGKTEFRHGIDFVYRNLRRIAQERNIHIATAAQANRSSLDGEEIGAGNVGESISIVQHAAKIISLYHTQEETMKGVVNLKVDIDRYKNSYDTVQAIQFLSASKFCIDSRFSSRTTG
jgi:hypothetical protein